MGKVIRWLRDREAVTAVLLSYLGLLVYHTHSFLYTTEFAGRDLVGAFSLVRVFEFGWSTDWFLGFPLFRFYPPGFFFTADTLGTLIGDTFAFKLLVYFFLLIFPFTVYYCFRQLFDERTALISVILSLAAVFLREPFSLIYQTLQVGLVAQMAAIPLLFIYIGVLWKVGRGSYYLSGLLMAAMVLIHPYIALVACIYTLFYLFLTRDLLSGFAASTGFLLTAWWWIPIIEKSWYMQAYTGPTGKLLNWPWLFLPLAMLDRGREALSLIATAVLLLIIGTFDFALPIQFYRFYIYGQIFLVLAAAPGLKAVSERLRDKTNPGVLIAILFLSLLAPAIAIDVSPEWRSGVELQGVVPEDGRMIVETSHSNLYNSYVPIQRIPLESNVTVVNGLYADQSVSSPYLLGLEKAFAKNPVPNPIAVEANLTSKQLEERFDYFGIGYALVRTEHAREKLSFMEVVSTNHDFKLLEMNVTQERQFRVVPVKGSYEEWEELNRQVFKENLSYFVYRSGYSPSFNIRDFGDSNALNTTRLEIEIESVRPKNKSQALFGLQFR